MTEKQFEKKLEELVKLVDKIDVHAAGKKFIDFIHENLHEAMDHVDYSDIDKSEDFVEYVSDGFDYFGEIACAVGELMQSTHAGLVKESEAK